MNHKETVAIALKSPQSYAYMMNIVQGITEMRGLSFEEKGKEVADLIREWKEQKEEIA